MPKIYDSKQVVFKLFGVPHSARDEATAAVARDFGLELKFKEEYGDIRASLIYNDQTTKVNADGAVKYFLNKFSQFVYSTEDESLEKCAVDLLKVRHLTLCTAESFTGGELARAIVSVPGASKIFYEGLVTYNVLAKEKRLGVSPATVSLKTVVSSEVAFEMVRGLLREGNCNVAAATTGYASPSDNPDEPCGLCYIAAGKGVNVNVCRYNFFGTREEIMKQGANAALYMLIKTVNAEE